jgi:hypothetical protein
MQKLMSCALYIDSFPLSGGTAFPEALIAGNHVIGLSAGTHGYSPADALRVEDADVFVGRAKAILHNDAAALAAQELARKDCIAFHEPNAVKARIRDVMATGRLAEPPDAISALGLPPILAEIKWDQTSKTKVPLPNRRGKYARRIHAVVAASHAKAFGFFKRPTLRLYATLLERALFVRKKS